MLPLKLSLGTPVLNRLWKFIFSIPNSSANLIILSKYKFPFSSLLINSLLIQDVISILYPNSLALFIFFTHLSKEPYPRIGSLISFIGPSILNVISSNILNSGFSNNSLLNCPFVSILTYSYPNSFDFFIKANKFLLSFFISYKVGSPPINVSLIAPISLKSSNNFTASLKSTSFFSTWKHISCLYKHCTHLKLQSSIK